MRPSRVSSCLLFAMLAFAAGACDDNAGIEINCAVACDHRLAICAEGCSYASCTRSLSREGCMQECEQAPAVSSMESLFQCLTAYDTCEEIRVCVAEAGNSDELPCGSDGCWSGAECRGGALEDYCAGPCPALEDTAVTGACGEYRWINRFQNSLDSLFEYYDAEGVLVGVEHWTDCNCFCDNRSFVKTFGSVPDCEREPLPPAGADVVAVSATGDSGAYTFSVTLRSRDTGCDQYADWWEVITPTGEFIYRRILEHSHIDEQPFTRSGGPVDVAPSTRVVVRGHMNTTGYSGLAFSGSVETGFGLDISVTGELAPGLAHETPLPSGCAF